MSKRVFAISSRSFFEIGIACLSDNRGDVELLVKVLGEAVEGVLVRNDGNVMD